MGVAHRFVRERDLEALRVLLQADPACVNARDESGCVPLYYAVTAKQPMPEIVELLLSAGADISADRIQEMPDMSMLEQLAGDGFKEFLEERGLEVPKEMFASRTPYRESLVRAAIKQGDVATVDLLSKHGADLHYVDEHGYTGVIDAVYGEGDRLPMVRYVLGVGLPVNVSTTYNETPARVASHLARFDALRELLAAGADETPLEWTPLLRAAAIGSPGDVARELQLESEVSSRDCWHRTAMDLALLSGDLEKAQMLLSAGAAFADSADGRDSSLICAVHSGNAALVRWAVESGCPIESRDFMGHTALTLAASSGNQEMVQTLLGMGADPNPQMEWGSILDDVEDKGTIQILLAGGADAGQLNHAAMRTLLGLGGDEDVLGSVTKAQYSAGKTPCEGRSNPEDITGPYKVAMIQAGVNAWRARETFGDPAKFACGIAGKQPDPVWCAQRFGQTLTSLPDGRAILIGGEHEDSYDPDFCIYNDVFVFSPDGKLRIFGYPYDVFPPTDFHTATLIEPWIYIIGNLGYYGSRGGATPVVRLNIHDLHIEPVQASGASAGRIYKHRATLVDGQIKIEGGMVVVGSGRKEEHLPNISVFQFDPKHMQWTALEPARG